MVAIACVLGCQRHFDVDVGPKGPVEIQCAWHSWDCGMEVPCQLVFGGAPIGGRSMCVHLLTLCA